MNNLSRAIIIFIAQGAYSGRSPFVPGTAGTLVGVLLYFWMKTLPPWVYFFLCVLIFLIGTWAAGRAEEILGCKDCPSIVIDEVAGYLVSMFMAPSSWGFAAAGFFIFRIFDIIKPYPCKRLQELHGGPGVMLDDIGAGIYTNIALQVAAYFIAS